MVHAIRAAPGEGPKQCGTKLDGKTSSLVPTYEARSEFSLREAQAYACPPVSHFLTETQPSRIPKFSPWQAVCFFTLLPGEAWFEMRERRNLFNLAQNRASSGTFA